MQEARHSCLASLARKRQARMPVLLFLCRVAYSFGGSIPKSRIESRLENL